MIVRMTSSVSSDIHGDGAAYSTCPAISRTYLPWKKISEETFQRYLGSDRFPSMLYSSAPRLTPPWPATDFEKTLSCKEERKPCCLRNYPRWNIPSNCDARQTRITSVQSPERAYRARTQEEGLCQAYKSIVSYSWRHGTESGCADS